MTGGGCPAGSIPAHAGEPSRPGMRWRLGRVYPRTCGGTRKAAKEELEAAGLSPHMRGNLQGRREDPGQERSIPAHAGEPAWREWPNRPLPGLSPHMRGNLRLPVSRQRHPGSIPAHAGEPTGGCQHVGIVRVYPRTCGGTACWRADPACRNGLSPHMRGNPCRPGAASLRHGSIPAHAGEPSP